MRFSFKHLGVAALAVVLSACLTDDRRPGNSAIAERALREGPLAPARFAGDVDSPELRRSLSLRSTQAMRSGEARRGPTTVLALSGGAEDGAFGAGLLNGWTARGNRPRFSIVTGVSTGALIAPLAFLGPERDADLKRSFTEVSADSIATFRGLGPILFGEAVLSSAPLEALVDKTVDEQLLRDVAREHQKGRRLWVLTTHLDMQRPIIWDLGVIAQKGDAESLALFRKVLLASASIPAVFPPVLIEGMIDGSAIEEMHVDGGVTRNMFFLPNNVSLRGAGWSAGGRPRIYAVHNGRTNPEFDNVKRRTLPIAKRSLATLMKTQTRSDIYDIANLADRNGADAVLASIGQDFTATASAPFDQNYMRQLFAYGEAKGRAGGFSAIEDGLVSSRSGQ